MVKGPPAAPVQPPKLALVLAVVSASRSEQPAPVPFSSAVVVTAIVLAAWAAGAGSAPNVARRRTANPPNDASVSMGRLRRTPGARAIRVRLAIAPRLRAALGRGRRRVPSILPPNALSSPGADR